ncbi:zonular occludens toxin domain-containing protein [uncultured Tolumonas sp.]|uniref:zonular occludens toxin domain-containing protein n=1 Tax=uncultured Tolumonas sp. TaxID=263765 RepID=UPI002A0A82C9|nr:zonular occludens toxin domain-containing protein [uncultured Tolumonas sp.]
MPCFAFTGKTGQGKGLCSAAFIGEYLQRGKLVATNMDIFPENFKDKYNKDIRIIRLPDIPTADDLRALGLGNPYPEDEDENALIMLDEVGVILNSRKWNQKGREELVSYIRHRRKYGFDMGFQIQGMGSLDTQVREDIIDYEVRCIKIQSLRIPIVSFFIKMATGKAFNKLPKSMRWHTAKFRNTETDMIDEVHRYTGKAVHHLYDTKQVISDEYPHGSYSLLTPWHLVGRYQPKPNYLKIVTNAFSYMILGFCAQFDKSCSDYLESKTRVHLQPVI